VTNNNNQRQNNTQLPTAKELLDILAMESARHAVRFDFISRNTELFAAHHHISTMAGSDDGWIDAYADMDLDQIVDKVNSNHSQITAFIKNNNDTNQNLYKALYAALVPDDDQAKSEALFVFGAMTNARIEKAVELYQGDIAPKIIISGRSPYYIHDMRPEASRMAEFAAEHGVPGRDVVIEESSITLPDNVKRSIDLLEQMDWRPKSLTIIATNFVLTRATMEWYKFCPWDIVINPVAARPQSSKFTQDGWYKDDDSIALVLNEYAKIVMESKIDIMRRDGEIK
jgi:DUF218 domain